MNTSNKLTRSFSVPALSMMMPMVIILLAGFPSTADAFHPLALQSRSPTKMRTSSIETTALWVSDQGLDEDESSAPLQAKTPQELSNQARWTQVKDINNKFWDYTCNFLYVGISGLILLNLSGYGYTISHEEGLNVMPIHTYRQERQWKEELERQRAFVAPTAASAIQKAPAAFLLQMQQK
jgi:hypothetical protein